MGAGLASAEDLRPYVARWPLNWRRDVVEGGGVACPGGEG